MASFVFVLVPATVESNEMAHQLHVLQTLMLNVLEERMRRAIETSDPDALEKVRELLRVAFDTDGTETSGVTTRKQQSPRDFRKLGFKNDTTPLSDFGEFPSS